MAESILMGLGVIALIVISLPLLIPIIAIIGTFIVGAVVALAVAACSIFGIKNKFNSNSFNCNSDVKINGRKIEGDVDYVDEDGNRVRVSKGNISISSRDSSITIDENGVTIKD